MRKMLLILFLLFSPIFTACIEPPEPVQTPPPVNTPMPPDETIKRFVRNYNERNASMLYSLFSERVRANYTLEDVEECLRLAEANGVKIIEWEIGEERYFINYSFLNVSLTLQWNGKTCNVTFELPMVVKEDYLIDEWIFEEFEFIFESTSGNQLSKMSESFFQMLILSS